MGKQTNAYKSTCFSGIHSWTSPGTVKAVARIKRKNVTLASVGRGDKKSNRSTGVDIFAVFKHESGGTRCVLRWFVHQARFNRIPLLEVWEAIAVRAECSFPGGAHCLWYGPGQLGVSQPQADEMTAGAVYWIDVGITSMQETEVVDEDDVSQLQVQAKSVLGCQGGENLEGFELLLAQSGDRVLGSDLGCCRVEAQSSWVYTDEDLFVGNMEEWRNNVSRRVAGPKSTFSS